MTREELKHFANCLKNNYTIDFNDMEDFCNEVIKSHDKLERIENLINDVGASYVETLYRMEEVLLND